MELGITVGFTGITIVALTLIGLSLFIVVTSFVVKHILKLVNSGRPKEPAREDESVSGEVPAPSEDYHSDEELVAVLTAAVLACMKNQPECNIRVKSFRRIPQTSPVWNLRGRHEQLTGKL